MAAGTAMMILAFFLAMVFLFVGMIWYPIKKIYKTASIIWAKKRDVNKGLSE
jgi:hypothetical protein